MILTQTGAEKTTDRWWITALAVALGGAVLVGLLWTFPTSRWLWLVVVGVLIFGGVQYFNPRYRYWRRASWCFGTAGVLALIPTLIAKANLEGIGSLEFASDSSPILVAAFLITGLVLSWLDNAPRRIPVNSNEPSSTSKIDVQMQDSPNSIAGLSAGRDIIIHQTPAPTNATQQLPAESKSIDEELIWRLIEDTKRDRRNLNQEESQSAMAKLEKFLDKKTYKLLKTTRREILLLIAEQERSNILRAKKAGENHDLARLDQLMKELGDA